MDARGWHPFRARVLTPASAAETQPELLKLTRTGALPEELKPHTDPARLNDLLDGRIPSPDAQGEVYRHLVLAACRFYHALLPNLFEKLDDETELLLPDDLLTEHSVVHGFRTEISDEDCGDGQRANVEILRWLYQFYISEKKDQVMARKSAVPTEDIPAVTQLFTPHWIVRYLVENSLGRLWLLNRPGSRLREHMPYYIEEVASDQWPVTSGEKAEVASGQNQSYANQNLQRPDRVAESHGPRGTNLQANQELSEGRTLRPDQPAAAGGGVRALEHRGGASTPIDSGIQELPFDSTGIIGGSGDADSAGHPLRISESASGHPGTQSARGNLQNALQSPKQTGHWPLITDHLRISSPEEIRLCDPAVGSAHMLTYAFDLLFLIYEEEGYAPTEIPALILRHNLHGLEICPRAAQLAELALVFKAWEKSRRFFQPEHLVRPHIIELRDVRFAENELPVQWLGASDQWPAGGSGQGSVASGQPGKVPAKEDILHDLHLFTDAKNFGSLLQPKLSEEQLNFLKQRVTDHWPLTTDHLFSNVVREHVLRVLEQAEALTQRYHVVVANPPYLGMANANSILKRFADDTYPRTKADAFAMFIERSSKLTIQHGYAGLVTMQSWLFLSSYADLRDDLLTKSRLINVVHIGPRGFDSIAGHVVQTVAFVVKVGAVSGGPTKFLRLVDYPSEATKEAALLKMISSGDGFLTAAADLRKIDGAPISYWIPAKARQHFEQLPALKSVNQPRTGISTGANERFILRWSEVSHSDIGLGLASKSSQFRYYPHNKGGDTRVWYGNQTDVLKYSAADIAAMERCDGFRHDNAPFYFRPSASWTKISWVASLPDTTRKVLRSIAPAWRCLNRSFLASSGF